eukprot:49462-Eustigmatos_ZCMA.PRE.1
MGVATLATRTPARPTPVHPDPTACGGAASARPVRHRRPGGGRQLPHSPIKRNGRHPVALEPGAHCGRRAVFAGPTHTSRYVV